MLAGLLVAAAATAAAQDYRVDRYTVDDGLPGAAVYGIAQDASGRMWFATNGGIAVYDGVEWVTSGEGTGLPRPPFGALLRDRGERLWVVADLAREPLARLVDGAWQPLAVPDRLRGGRMSNAVLAATRWGGREVLAVGTSNDGLWLWQGREWRRVGKDEGLPSASIRGIAAAGERLAVVTADGLAWVGQAGVEPFPPRLLPPAEDGLLAVAASPAASRAGASVWVLAPTWLGRIDGTAFELVTDRIRLETYRPGPPAVLTLGPSGELWAGYRARLLRVDPGSGRAELVGRDNGLANEGATAVLVDREGNIWLGGTRGVGKLVSMQFASWRAEHGLLEDEVTAAAEPAPGTLVLGHNHGLTILAGGSARRIRFADPGDGRSTRVLDLAAHDDRSVWVAAADLGLARLDVPTGSLRWYPSVSEVVSSVSSVTESGPFGGPLIGGSGGLFELDARGEPSLVADTPGWIRRHMVDHRGRIWIASGGLYLLDGGSVREVPGESFAALGGVYALAEDSAGRIWIGTRRGLYEVSRGRIERPSAPRIDDAVFGVLEDGEGRLWIGTDTGVLRWDGVGQPVRFTTRDGLAGREVNRDALLLDSRSSVWIGTEGGISQHRSALERPPAPPPVLEILSCEVDGRELAPAEPVRMPIGADALEYRYRAVSFVDERAVRYRVHLEGLDGSWSDPLPATSRSRRYTYLPPGRYRFAVRAANADGVWSEPVRSAWVRVPTPPWRHWAVIAAAVALLLGGAGVAVAMALRWRYATRLEAEVAARTVELRESEQWSRRLFEEESLARLVVDPGPGTVIDANAAACRMLDLPHPVEARTPFGLGHERLEEIRAGRAEETGHELVRTGDGRDLEVWRQPLLRGGRRLQLITVADVTERRRLSEARERAAHLEAVGRLAGGIAHDFNNLLATLVGRLAVAELRVETGEDPRPELESASEIVLRARHLTGQLLTFASGGEPMLRVVDPSRVIEEAVGLLGAASGVSIRVDSEGDLWPVMADQGQLVQVVANLLMHAERSMPEGGPIVVRTANRPDGGAAPDLDVPSGPVVEIEVRDSGPTLPEEELARLEEPYAHGGEGLAGLGLATAFAIVRRHGGTMVADPAPGGGTSIRVLVPAVPGAAVVHPARRVERAQGSGRVLAMDDDPDLRTLYRDVLRLLGYDVEVASDGESAIQAYRDAADRGQPFEVVILDLTVGAGLGGLECLAHLREIDPEVRAIVASGYSNDPVMARYREEGFVTALAKPFSVAELSRVVRETAEKRR